MTECGDATSPEEVLVKGVEIACPELSGGRVVLERYRKDEMLLVLRVARVPSRPKAVPAHFLLLEIVDLDGGVWVESESVMKLPARKNETPRDQPTIEPRENA